MPCHPSAKPSSPTGCFRWDVSAPGKHPWNQKQTKPSRIISGLALNHLKTPQQHGAAVSKRGKHTKEAENGAGTQNISQTPAVCWRQFAQGLSPSVMVSLYPLALEGFVLCALKKPSFPHTHTEPRLPKHPSDIPAGSNRDLRAAANLNSPWDLCGAASWKQIIYQAQ